MLGAMLMTPVWGLLVILWLQGALAGGLLASPLRVAQCRAKCVHTFSGDMDHSHTCLQTTNCNTCWEQCQRLGVGWSAVCHQESTCQAGCRQACRFHLQQEVQRSPVLVTRGEEVITLGTDLASWPPPSAPGPAVFVLMCRQTDNTWSQVAQTLELSWSLPASLSCETVRVMVVGLEGLVTVYSPAPSPLHDAEVIMRSVGQELYPSLTAMQDNTITESLRTNVSPNNNYQHGTWNLREVSLIHQGVLVIAEVAWDHQTPSYPAVYLVTWELEGGGLKGSLLTDSTCVTLSLWPDTVYRIQVQLVREPERLSETLDLDTRQASPLLPRSESQPLLSHPGFEGVAGVTAAFFLFLAVALLLSSRSRVSASSDKSCVLQDLSSVDHFKLYPPPVRLLLEPCPPPVVVPDVPITVPKSSSPHHLAV